MPKKRKKQKADRRTATPVISVEERARKKSRILLILIALGVVMVGSLLFVSNYLLPSDAGKFGAFRNHNVVLITIDTLRADHLPVYGYQHGKTPHIDALAEESLIFNDAQAHVPMTLPSHASLFTGLLPIQHGVADNSFSSLDSKMTTLAEVLKDKGYKTAAFVSSVVLHSGRKINQGFDHYDENFEQPDQPDRLPSQEASRLAGDTQKAVDQWLSQNTQGNFFLWVHYYDPHDPYEPPEPYKSRFPQSPYDGEIAYTDEMVGRLLNGLEQKGLKDRTLIVLTSDHGESLGEHGEHTHGIFLYDSTLRVPLLIRLPNVRSRRIEPVVRLVDLMPTLLEWLGYSADPLMHGRSLFPVIQEKEPQERLAFSESKYAELHYGWSGLSSVATSEFRFVQAPNLELYQRKQDPSEKQNLIQQNSAMTKVLQSKIVEIEQQYARTDNFQKMDPEMEEKLRSLGYISSRAQTTEESRQIDPKDKIHLHRALSEAFAATRQKNHTRVLQLLLPVLKESPDMIEAHYLAGLALAELHDYPNAIDQFLKTIRLRPDYTMAQFNLAVAYQAAGEFKEAETWYKQVLKYDPDHTAASAKLVQVYMLAKQPALARPYFEKSVRQYQNNLRAAQSAQAQANAHASLAELYLNTGNLNQAENHLRTAIRLTPDAPSNHYNLAQILEMKRDKGAAASEYELETQINPANFMAFHNLGMLYKEQKRFPEAARCFERVLSLRPGDLTASYMLAECYLHSGSSLQRALQLAQSVTQRKPDLKEAHQLVAAISQKLGRNGAR